MMKKPLTAATPSTVPPAMLVELTDAMLDMVSGGDNGIGEIMGPMLDSAGGMSAMMAKKNMTDQQMGQMLATDGGMKNAMSMGARG